MCISLLLTIGVSYVFYLNAQAKDYSRFQSEAKSVKNRLELLINSYITTIKAGRGFVESTSELDREKFSAFVEDLGLAGSYKGFTGLGLIKRIPKLSKTEIVPTFLNPASPDVRIFTEAQNFDNQTIIYLEPFNKDNHSVISLDNSTEPARLEAMEKSRDYGEPAATGKILLRDQSNAEKKSGFLIYLPIYKEGKMPPNLEDKKFFLEGFVYGLIQTEDFLSDVQKSISTEDIAFTIYESRVAPENIIAQTHSDKLPVKADFTLSNEMSVGGRNWIIESQTLPTFSQQSNSRWTMLIFISGLIFSLLMFGMTYLETFARLKAENIAGELRKSEREKAFLLESEQIERKRAEEANNAKDEFISIVSHELRTPLNAIAGWAQILHGATLSIKTKKLALQKIDKNLRVQAKIVEDLLDFTQIISNKSDVIKQEVNFSQIFEQAIRQTQALADEKGVLLVKENELNGQVIIGDSERLQKMIINLLSNAIKFTPQGGEILAELKKLDNKIEMTIKDSGLGISSEVLPHIFEHFKQGDSSITRQHGGLGLGLAISQQIIKLHGGRIKVNSEGEGKGSIFTVRLPYKINPTLK
ncbi:MAG: CHASE domain-containing protein [Pyrinomonadaceae bacterium]